MGPGSYDDNCFYYFQKKFSTLVWGSMKFKFMGIWVIGYTVSYDGVDTHMSAYGNIFWLSLCGSHTSIEILFEILLKD